VLARVGQDLRAVDRDGDPADMEHAAAGGQLQDLGERLLQERSVLAPEGAEHVVVRMRVGAEQAHRDILVGRALDLPA